MSSFAVNEQNEDATVAESISVNKAVIYTDLDGTLLDHHNYDHSAVDELLEQLEQAAIPVVFCSSKTRSEMQQLKTTLGNRHPFIIENGAAVIIPKGYSSTQPTNCLESGGDWVMPFCNVRTHWLNIIHMIAHSFRSEFLGFSDMSLEQIANCTGLSMADAKRAREREYGEPIQWLGSEQRKQAFISAIQALDGSVLQGGRFLHVSGHCNKGKALNWLQHYFDDLNTTGPLLSIAAGDSQNDSAMLEVADHALIIRSPVNPTPRLKRNTQLTISSKIGPAGWDEGIRNILNQIDETIIGEHNG